MRREYVIWGVILLVIGVVVFIITFQRFTDLSSGFGQLARALNPDLQREYEQIVIPSLIVSSVVGIVGFVLCLVGVQMPEAPKKRARAILGSDRMNRLVTVIGMIVSILGLFFVLLGEYKSRGVADLVASLEFMVGLSLVITGIIVTVVGLALARERT